MDKNVNELAIEFDMAVNEAKQACLMSLGNSVLDMSAQELELLKKFMLVVDTSVKLIRKQADIIQKMDEKLDKVLSFTET